VCEKQCSVYVSRKDYVRHPVCKLWRRHALYNPPAGEVESLTSYQKDYTCTRMDSDVGLGVKCSCLRLQVCRQRNFVCI